MNIQTVGVIGAGVMGVGVAQNLAQTGHHAVLLDISDDILNEQNRKSKITSVFKGFSTKMRKPIVQMTFWIKLLFPLTISS